MSISGDSTVTFSRDHEDSHQSLDGETYGIEGMIVSPSEKSPYANAQIVSLEVGPHAIRFDVHGTILQQSAELAAKFDPWGLKKLPVPLPEIDEATAHTLIHYLYTGAYQALGSSKQFDKAVGVNYKLGICAYCAAIRYKLPGLIELAREKITTFGEDVDIFEILAVAKDHAFPMLPPEESWYPEYIASAIQSAMVENPEPFKRPDFVTRVEGNSRLLQVVWKTVISSYAPTPVTHVNIDNGAITPTAEKMPDGKLSQVSQEEEIAVEDRILVDEAEDAGLVEQSVVSDAADPTALHEPVTTQIDDMQNDTFKLDEIEPKDTTPQAPDSFTDELGYGSSKTYQQMGKRSEQFTNTASSTGVGGLKSDYARSDSVIDVQGIIFAPGAEEKASIGGETMNALEESTQVVGRAIEDFQIPKKPRKTKKKKGTTFT